MRLIDAEPLSEGIELHRQPTDQTHEIDRQWAVGYNAGLDRALYSIAYAKTIAPPPNDPLTLDELREMDEEPVYLDFGDGGEWALVKVQQGKVFFIHKNTICAPANILFECGGKAYRRKPEETNNGITTLR